MVDNLPTQEPERPKPAGNPDCQSGESGKESPQAKSVITRPPSDIPQTPSNTTNSNDGGKCPHQAKPNWVEVGTFILEIFGIIGLAYYCWINQRELNVFNRERLLMEKEQSIAEQSHHREQRAWVFFHSLNFVVNKAGETTSNAVWHIDYKNSGRTPAINVQVMTYSAGSLKAIPLHDPRPTASNPFNGMIGPDDFLRTADGVIPEGIVSQINSLTPYYIFGTVWYDDIFGNHHWTQFCYQLTGAFECAPIGTHNTCDDAENSKNGEDLIRP